MGGQPKQGAPRLCTYDIESSFNIGGYFGRPYDANISKVIQRFYVFGFAYKYMDERTVRTCYIWDFPLYKQDPRNDIEVVKKWQEVMAGVDYRIGHNSNSFDNQIMRGRVAIHRLPLQSEPENIDTLRMAKRVGRYDSYKLDDLGEMFGLGRKLHTDADLWWDCMQGVEKQMKRMVTYNKRDVALTEKLYKFLMQYDPTAGGHRNRANIAERPGACPYCGVSGFMQSAGWKYTSISRYRQFMCGNCHRKSRSRTADKTDKPEYV
ncbi:MAG TPA: ribonuclease H-like domain-containing protein [Candidatus Saccharimonadales bacterium]|nr:ribonuclease H-like domain-containing protein [Candidatus Saccharimonadales bacterium]